MVNQPDHTPEDELWKPLSVEHEAQREVAPDAHGNSTQRDGSEIWRYGAVTRARSRAVVSVAVEEWVRHRLRLDLEARALVWVALFGIGIVGYFYVPREPYLPAMVLLLGLTAWFATRARMRDAMPGGLGAIPLAACGAVLLAGSVVAQLQVNRVKTPMLAEPVTASLSATVLFSEVRADGGQRVDLLLHDVENGVASSFPAKIRLTLRQEGLLPAGSFATGRARLMPHTGPVYPGGYDFGFAHFFEKRGALGFSLGDLIISPRPAALDLGWPSRLRIAQSRVRSSLAARIRSSLPGEAGHIAVALITGERQAISKETNESLRASGLAHILAISGLHMTLIVGSVFFGLRFLIAQHPTWSLNYPIKKIAAAAALGVATLYLALSGAGLATQRAYITLAVMLVALLLDRRAISLRNVAVAAAIVLVWQPHAIFLAGFQMSFAAVIALVASYRTFAQLREQAQAWRESGLPLSQSQARLVRWLGSQSEFRDRTFPARFAVSVRRFFVGLALTSFIAGLATGLFAAWHFHRVAPLGLVANLLAMPFVSVAVMPGLLSSMIALPFGLDPFALAWAGWGVDQVRGVAQRIAAQGPSGYVGLLPPAVFAVALVAFSLAVCLKGIGKALAAPVFVGAILVWTTGVATVSSPDVLISADGKLVAVRADDGSYRFNTTRAQSFTRDIWLRAFAPAHGADEAVPEMVCDRDGCLAQAPGGVFVSWAKTPEALREDCEKAGLVVTNLPPPRTCSAKLLSMSNSGPKASLAIRFDADGEHHAMHIETSATNRARIWNQRQSIQFHTPR